MVNFLFETREVPVEATDFVRELLTETRGGCVYGVPGSGKSHAVRAAFQGLPGGLCVDVTDGPLLGLRFLADVARQIGQEGRRVLEAVRREGVKAAIEVAEPAINGHPFVVDDAHLLLGSPLNLEDPATALWQEEKSAVLDWLRGRLERTPTVLVGQRCIPEVAKSRRHQMPLGEWPLLLKKTPDGFRDWARLAELAGGNPAAFMLAGALVPCLSAGDFNDFVAQAKADDVGERELLRRLGEVFWSNAPPPWHLVLALLAAVGEVPRDVLEAVLDAPVVGALAPLSKLRLVEERPTGLSVLPALIDAAAVRPLAGQEHADLLRDVAHRLLASINDVRSLEPEHADRVLRAHAIFVDLGDMAGAERTAALHVHGLVGLARRTSLNKDYRRSWQEYDGVWRMLQSGTFGTADDTGQHLMSYVRHYRAWNGQKAGVLDEATCLDEYRVSVQEWPKNALWHQRTIQGQIRLGHLVEAREALHVAYEQVPEHPRRDELLRARPARTAMHAGAPVLSLELLVPVLDAPGELYPDLATERDDLLRLWAQGIELEELSYRPTANEQIEFEDARQGRVVFLRPAKVSVRRTAAAWVARLPELAADGRGDGPLAALEVLGNGLASEARRLISTPSSQLDERSLRRKGAILSLMDALNSDIGLEHAEQRWIVGKIEPGRFIPTMRDMPPADVPAGLMPESTEGLYFARVPVYRDGTPSGPVKELKMAGRGRTLGDLIELLSKMSEGEA